LDRDLSVDQADILKKIEEIRRELSQDQYELLKQKILERSFHLHKSNRNPLSRRIIERLRSRLTKEVELIMGPILDNQQEINLRLLEEIERLKQAVLKFSPDPTGPKHESSRQTVSEESEI